ncbi:hypothetical protein JCM6882_001236 [Rhodosporidiobolus microsporus]
MSTRASSTSITHTSSGQNGVGIRIDDDDLAESVKKKARKAAKSKGKGKSKGSKKNVGKLAPLLDMPVDTFIEVAKHLDPLTLLHLSRASKSFRQLFASRSAKGIWRAVKSAVNFPDLKADDLSDMAHIALMYDNTCNVCARPAGSARNIKLVLRKRFCEDCLPRSSLELEGEVYRERPQPEPHPLLHECLLVTNDGRNDCHHLLRTIAHPNGGVYYARERWVFKPEVEAVNKKLHELQELAGVLCDESPESLTEAEAMQAAKRAEMKEGKDEFKFEEKELAAFVNRRRALVAAVAADAEALEHWEKTSPIVIRKAGEDLKKQRYEAIVAKVEEAGHDKQDLHVNGTEIGKLVFQPRPFSTGTWDVISADVLAHVEKNRNRRLEQEKFYRQMRAEFRLRPYYDSMLAFQTAVDEAASLPPLAEFIHLPAVAQFWLDDPPATLNEEAWGAAGPTILQEVKVEAEKLAAAEDVS